MTVVVIWVKMPFYVLAMPIGHTDDISARALDVLRRADLILAEDTAKSAKLLSVYGIKTKARLRRCDAHTEETIAAGRAGSGIEDLIGKNDSVVLISGCRQSDRIGSGAEAGSRHASKRSPRDPDSGSIRVRGRPVRIGVLGGSFLFRGLSAQR